MAKVVEIPVRLVVREEPSEALALLRHFLFGEITPERVARARALLIECKAWDA